MVVFEDGEKKVSQGGDFLWSRFVQSSVDSVVKGCSWVRSEEGGQMVPRVSPSCDMM